MKTTRFLPVVNGSAFGYHSLRTICPKRIQSEGATREPILM